MNYLDDSLKNIEHRTVEVGGDVYEWWGVGESTVFVLIIDIHGKIAIWFEGLYLVSLSDLFGISEDEIKSYLLEWIKSRLDIHPNNITNQD